MSTKNGCVCWLGGLANHRADCPERGSVTRNDAFDPIPPAPLPPIRRVPALNPPTPFPGPPPQKAENTMQTTTKINLGDRVKDKITGFYGIVVAITHWLNGCVRVSIQPEKLEKDGKIPDSQAFDEAQLVVVKRAAVAPHGQVTHPAGPRPDPKRQKDVG